MGQRTDRLVVRRDVDFTRLSLTPEEGFVLSRAEGCGSVGELLAIAGLPEAQATAVLRSLSEKGVLLAEAAGKAPSKPPRTANRPAATQAETGAARKEVQQGARPVPPPGTKGRYEGFIFNPADLAEAVDLSKEVCKELLFIDAHLEKWTHYDLLAVRPATPTADIRKRYLELSRMFHPDRYYGKSLGSYASRMSRVFQAITKAHETLSDPERKAEYDRVTDVPLTEEELAAAAAEQEARRRDAELAEERRERLRRRNPMMRQRAKVQQYVEEAEKAESREDWRKAANLYRLALGHGPPDAAIEARLQAVDQKAAQMRADDLVEKAQSASVLGHEEQAFEMIEAALEAAPKHLEALLAKTWMLKSRGAANDEILETARQAVASDRRSFKAWLLYGQALLRNGEKKEAKAAFTKVLEINPKNEEAQEALKKLRWSLF